MRKLIVEITETLCKDVLVEASDERDAERLVRERWLDSKYILDYEDCIDVKFKTKEERKESMKVDVILCYECKYFRADGEICSFWGRGCKTVSNGYCFAGERKEAGENDDVDRLLHAVMEGRSKDAKKIAEEINSKVRN